MTSWEDIPGWFDFQDFYQEIVDRYPGGLLIEVGCYLGRSLCCLGEMVKKSGKPFKVVGVDWCLGSGVERPAGSDPVDHHLEALKRGGGTLAGQLHRNVLDCNLDGLVHLMVMDSAEAARLLWHQSATMVFLDGRHDYEGVKRDIEAWKPVVTPGGVLAGDDFCDVWPGVKRAVTELLPGYRTVSHDSWEWRSG